MATTTNIIDLRTCTPNELASYLLSYRFDNNAMSATSFLLECATALLDAKGMSARLMGCVDNDDKVEDKEHYVDMIATLNNIVEGRTTTRTNRKKKSTSALDSSVLELTNIHRGKLSILNNYVHGVLIPDMRLDANNNGSTTIDIGRANGARDISFNKEGGEGDYNDNNCKHVAVAEVVDGHDHDMESAKIIRKGRHGRRTHAASRAA